MNKKWRWLTPTRSGENGGDSKMGEPFEAVVLGDTSKEPTCSVSISWANQEFIYFPKWSQKQRRNS